VYYCAIGVDESYLSFLSPHGISPFIKMSLLIFISYSFLSLLLTHS
jgi:hypothetical protein